MTDRPLVSCIMPTHNRRRFVPRALAYFQRQDYPNRELIIIDDGTDSVADLVPTDDPRIRYIRLEHRQTVGAKRNLACEAGAGDLLMNWDDDDWYAPNRISLQVAAMLQEGAELCGINTLLYYDMKKDRAWRYVYPRNRRPWLAGGTLCYTRTFWSRNRYPDIDIGEDARFVWNKAAAKMVALTDIDWNVSVIHDRNISPKRTEGSWWKPHPVEEIERIVGADWAFYRAEPGSAKPPAVEEPVLVAPGPGAAEAVARTAHLRRPEFAAFSHGVALPRMRRWELPFALWQARLGNTDAVLDCSINPAGLEERIGRLYPDVLYRRWSPVQHGQFLLPVGVPDGSFDRVFCINTLEHLLLPQREELLAAMARKLKPGGLLILTSDYYFDSLWERPELLKRGLLRADRLEVFNGWNRVTPAELQVLCGRVGLSPVLLPSAPPDEADAGLYRNEEPYPHGCFGAVFQRGPVSALSGAGRRVMLAMLTWNTRAVTLEGVQALLAEARMLRRLGHEPLVCICDNGSDDGSAEALRALERGAGVELRLILNEQNRGSSVARNQIITAMLEAGADYLLLVDGDVEIIPFSTVAMLRHMENMGHRLGCIGADSAGQTGFRERATPYLYSVGKVERSNLVAWTQYGLFRREVFADGVRFEEAGPFGEPGWGFEDNDLAFQMELKGYLIQRFMGQTYLHRALRSSTRNLREQGIDPNPLFERRRAAVVAKWSEVARISEGPLILVRRMQVKL